MNKPIILTGPTASGKSQLAIEIAKEVNGIIINSDSRQIYREVPISTSQPTPEKVFRNYFILDNIRHYMYSFKNLPEPYNIYQYNSDIKLLLKNLKVYEKGYAKPITPIIVGGTGLYVDSFAYNYTIPKNSISSYERRDLVMMSIDQLQEIIGDRLELLNESDRRNPVRLIREIERKGNLGTKGSLINCTYIYIDVDITKIELSINNRILQMVETGLEKEAREVYDRYYRKGIQIPKIIGIHEFFNYFKGEVDKNKVIDEIALHTRQYAKRQITWFKKNKDISQVQQEDIDVMKRKVLFIAKEGI